MNLPLPGSIIGLIILLLLLLFKIIPKEFVADGATFLLSVLTLLFIPATVGVINYPELLSLHGVVLVIIVVLSTIFAIGVTGKFAQRMEKKETNKTDPNHKEVE